MRAITDNLIWGYGTVATIILAGLIFFGVLDWPWWCAGVPYYVLFVWMLAYLSVVQLHPVAALGAIWAGIATPLNFAGVIEIGWWLVFLPFVVLGLLAGLLRRKS